MDIQWILSDILKSMTNVNIVFDLIKNRVIGKNCCCLEPHVIIFTY